MRADPRRDYLLGMWTLLTLLACERAPFLDPLAEGVPEGAFMSVWGPAPDAIWVVGGQAEAGVAWRGSAANGFLPVDLPEGTPLINWVHGVAEDDLWLGGLGGTLLHWDGADWTDHTDAREEAVWGVHAVASDDVWAVGGLSRWGGDTYLLRHWDGASWSDVALPAEAEGAQNLFKVHAEGAGAPIWLVGEGGVAFRGGVDGFEPAATGFAMDLVTVTGWGERVVAVGGRNTGAVLTPEGDGLAIRARTTAGLNGVAPLGDGRVLVAGERGYLATVDPESGEVVELPASTPDVLHAAWVLGDDLYAVGGNLFAADAVFHGVILHGRVR